MGGKRVAEIVLHDDAFYTKNAVDLRLGIKVTRVDPAAHSVHDDQGNSYRYDRLLLATGGTPKQLNIPGGDLDGISYYRTLEHYRQLRSTAGRGQIGAGHWRRVHRLGNSRVSSRQPIGGHDGLPWLVAGVTRISGIAG
jgi:3-phenylpropionate/trans-cinnamate dioxygenase ferredoxin reductase subunit